jgi:hypothetical protein
MALVVANLSAHDNGAGREISENGSQINQYLE